MIQVKVLCLAIIIGLPVTTVQAEQLKSFDLVSGDAVSVKLVFSRNFPISLEVALGHQKARELEDLTKTSVNQKIVLIINEEVIGKPTVRQTVSDGILRFWPEDEATALRLAKLLTALKPAP